MISWILPIYLLFVDYSPKAIDPCEVYGRIYSIGNSREADFSVYVENTEAFADIVVYKQKNALYADRPGQWSFVNNKKMARVYIYFEKRRNMADFTIAYTDIESFAGCNR